MTALIYKQRLHGQIWNPASFFHSVDLPDYVQALELEGQIWFLHNLQSGTWTSCFASEGAIAHNIQENKWCADLHFEALLCKNNHSSNLHQRLNKQTRCRAAIGGVLVAQQCVGNLATPALGPCWLPLCHCPPLLCHLPSSHLNDLLSNIVKHHRDVLCVQLYNLLL